MLTGPALAAERFLYARGTADPVHVIRSVLVSAVVVLHLLVSYSSFLGETPTELHKNLRVGVGTELGALFYWIASDTWFPPRGPASAVPPANDAPSKGIIRQISSLSTPHHHFLYCIEMATIHILTIFAPANQLVYHVFFWDFTVTYNYRYNRLRKIPGKFHFFPDFF
jgi:hypothetical protein